ncbi:BatD family protein [Amphritea japonica]|nr:BatD family protein [Amphritea japonica]
MSFLFHPARSTLAGFIALIALPVLAQVSVFSDRYSVAEGETLRLTVEVDQRASGRPDFSPLTRDFHFLGSKQMTVSSFANGENQYTTRWQILLRPRHSGELQIPPLQFNNEFSQPLLITVAGETGAAAIISNDAYLESAVDGYEVYQGSQVLYSQRLFHLDDLPPMASLSEPLIPDTEIVPLGEKQQYTREINGQTYKVVEQNYALFPQQAGQLSIPAAHFSAGPGTPELNSEPIFIDVLPQPSQKIRGYWLPSSKLSLEDLTQSPNHLTVGESQTRTLKITAEGLLAEQLPSLISLRNELATIEVEDVQLEQKNTVKGIISSRTETVRITPVERGEVTLPAITIPWWNLTLDKSEKASLPQIVLRVEPASPRNEPLADAPAPAAETDQADKERSVDTTANTETNGSVRLLVWLLASVAIITSLGWLYSFSSQRRKQPAQKNQQSEPSPPTQTPPINDSDKLNQILKAEQLAFSQALDACNNDTPLEARLLMLEWARLFWPHIQFNNSLDLSELNNSKTLELLLIDMESYISGSEAGPWSGDLLASALMHIRENQLKPQA